METLEAKTERKISQMIVDEMEAGKTMQEAFDIVLGSGAYKQLASDLYDSFRGVK